MKSFKQLISEKKDHIIKKMPNLSDEEKAILIDFFKKKPNLESKINWNKWKKLTFADFKPVMKETSSERKRKEQKQRRKGISGLKRGKDYIELKTRNKEYDVYIPLNPKASKVIASPHIGGCRGNWCLSSSQASKYYRREAKKKRLIPIMVIGRGEKYTVMMPPTMNHWTVWNKENKAPQYGEVIPGFSIKKELVSPKLGKLYQEIIDEIWPRDIGKPPKGVDKSDYRIAVDAYFNMIDDISDYFEGQVAANDEYWEEMERTRIDTIDWYEEEIAEKEYDIEKYKEMIKKKEFPKGYSQSFIEGDIDDAEGFVEEAKEIIEKLKDATASDMVSDYFYSDMYDNVEFQGNGIYEFDVYEGSHMPNIEYGYEDYFFYMEKYAEDPPAPHEVENAIYEMDSYYSPDTISEDEIIDTLNDVGAVHPQKIREEYESV